MKTRFRFGNVNSVMQMPALPASKKIAEKNQELFLNREGGKHTLTSEIKFTRVSRYI